MIKMRMVPQSHMFGCLVLSWWKYLGRIRAYGLVGGASLGLSFEVSKALFALGCGSRCECSMAVLVAHFGAFIPPS